MADPDWFVKVLSGRGDAADIYKYTNCCEGLDQKHKMVTCQLWDRTDMDAPGVKRTPDGKRRATAPVTAVSFPRLFARLLIMTPVGTRLDRKIKGFFVGFFSFAIKLVLA